MKREKLTFKIIDKSDKQDLYHNKIDLNIDEYCFIEEEKKDDSTDLKEVSFTIKKDENMSKLKSELKEFLDEKLGDYKSENKKYKENPNSIKYKIDG